jgi:hypothetical protein
VYSNADNILVDAQTKTVCRKISYRRSQNFAAENFKTFYWHFTIVRVCFILQNHPSFNAVQGKEKKQNKRSVKQIKNQLNQQKILKDS